MIIDYPLSTIGKVRLLLPIVPSARLSLWLKSLSARLRLRKKQGELKLAKTISMMKITSTSTSRRSSKKRNRQTTGKKAESKL